MNFFYIGMVAILLAGSTGAANAADTFTLSLDNPIQTVVQGAAVPFTGSIVNEVPYFVNIDTMSVTFAAPGDAFILADYTPFLSASFPSGLQPSGTSGDTYSGGMFAADLSGATPPGDYSGSIDIAGDYIDSNANDVLFTATQNFRLTVQAVATPEPSSYMSFGAAITGIAWCILAAKRRRTMNA